MELGGASALTLANRAECLLLLRRPLAAISDCNEALKLNPDSAKALRFLEIQILSRLYSN